MKIPSEHIEQINKEFEAIQAVISSGVTDEEMTFLVISNVLDKDVQFCMGVGTCTSLVLALCRLLEMYPFLKKPLMAYLAIDEIEQAAAMDQ